jgi:glycosyltransferase A (GT-A) superfamily protein (DUF2064 family)
MATKKHALLLFSKPPVPGLVKTRLTREKGGPFSPDEAAEIFRRCMFDVAELCCLALHELEVENVAERSADSSADEHSYSFFISTTPEENVDVIRQTFEEIGQWPREFTYLADEGSTFDEHLNSAFKQIFDLGFDSILSVSADVPLLPREHIVNGFRWLQYFLETSEKGGVIQAPCQDAGISLIGWTRDADIDHQGVYENTNGCPALDVYVEKAKEKEIPVASMMPVAGIDDVSDFAHATSLARAAQYSQQFQPDLYVPARFLAWVDWRGIRVGTPPSEDDDSQEDSDI